MAFRLSNLNLTLAHSKGQGQGHTHFDREYLANDNRQNLAYANSHEVACDLSIGIYTFDLGTL